MSAAGERSPLFVGYFCRFFCKENTFYFCRDVHDSFKVKIIEGVGLRLKNLCSAKL